MENDFEIKDGNVYRHGKLFIPADGNAQDIMIFDNRIVILLNPETIYSDRNVVCYDFTKKLVWQIIDPPRVHA